MDSRKHRVITGVAIVGLAVSLLSLQRARSTLRDRDDQLRRLRERTAELEDEVARLSVATDLTGLSREQRDAYLSLPYEAFDATPGSGHRRFRDEPQNPARAGALIEAYLQGRPELSVEQRRILGFHAAQLFAIGGMNERAVVHLDRLLSEHDGDHTAAATKAFLLSDRAGLLAARRRMRDGDAAAEAVDVLVARFGESYADVARWATVCSTAVRMPAGASAAQRAAADRLARAFGLPVAVADRAANADGRPADIPGGCIWMEIRATGGTPDVEGYVILHANNGTVIAATSERRLEAAVTRFVDSSRLHNGRREAPFGLATSFELAR
jgi:hypothetical protein